jgi:hypothetical protein
MRMKRYKGEAIMAKPKRRTHQLSDGEKKAHGAAAARKLRAKKIMVLVEEISTIYNPKEHTDKWFQLVPYSVVNNSRLQVVVFPNGELTDYDPDNVNHNDLPKFKTNSGYKRGNKNAHRNGFDVFFLNSNEKWEKLKDPLESANRVLRVFGRSDTEIKDKKDIGLRGFEYIVNVDVDYGFKKNYDRAIDVEDKFKIYAGNLGADTSDLSRIQLNMKTKSWRFREGQRYLTRPTNKKVAMRCRKKNDVHDQSVTRLACNNERSNTEITNTNRAFGLASQPNDPYQCLTLSPDPSALTLNFSPPVSNDNRSSSSTSTSISRPFGLANQANPPYGYFDLSVDTSALTSTFSPPVSNDNRSSSSTSTSTSRPFGLASQTNGPYQCLDLSLDTSALTPNFSLPVANDNRSSSSTSTTTSSSFGLANQTNPSYGYFDLSPNTPAHVSNGALPVSNDNRHSSSTSTNRNTLFGLSNQSNNATWDLGLNIETPEANQDDNRGLTESSSTNPLMKAPAEPNVGSSQVLSDDELFNKISDDFLSSLNSNTSHVSGKTPAKSNQGTGFSFFDAPSSTPDDNGINNQDDFDFDFDFDLI